MAAVARNEIAASVSESTGGEARGTTEDALSRARTWLAERVLGGEFPPLPGRWNRAIGLAALTLLGAAINALRIPVSSWNVLWAEDGLVFLRGALTSSPAVVVEPYAGYLHLVPRLLVEIAVLFPLTVVPAVLTLLAAVTAGLLASATYLFIETLIENKTLAIASWFAIVALPIAGGEVVGSIANLHWFLQIASFCAVAARSAHRGNGFAIAQGLVIVAAITSDALALLLLPLIALRAWALPSRREKILAGAAGVAALLQLLGMVVATTAGGLQTRNYSAIAPTLGEFLDFYAVRVISPAWLGITGTTRFGEFASTQLPLIMIIATVTLVVAGMRSNALRGRASIGVFVLGSAGFAVIVDTLQWEWLSAPPALDLNEGGRYAVVPTALLIIALVVAADGLLARVARNRHRAARVATVVIVAALVIVPVIDFRVWNVRAGAPSWSEAVVAAEADCSAAPVDQVTLPRMPDFVIPLEVPCAAVVDRMP